VARQATRYQGVAIKDGIGRRDGVLRLTALSHRHRQAGTQSIHSDFNGTIQFPGIRASIFSLNFSLFGNQGVHFFIAEFSPKRALNVSNFSNNALFPLHPP
jgi:hypothetical protein